MRAAVLVGGAVLVAVAGIGTAALHEIRAPSPAGSGAGAVGPLTHLPAVSAQQRRPRRPRPRGTDAWKLTKPATEGQVEGYASSISVAPGRPVALRVSTTAARFHVVAFRFGWYRGGAAHVVWRSTSLPGRDQSGPSFANYDRRTVVALWQRSATVPTTGWLPGAYVLKLVASTGWQYDVPLFVRSPSTQGRVALVAPVATWEAYNDWGGYSLYAGPSNDRRAWAVSFDRPFRPPGAAGLLFSVVPVVLRAERLGIPLAYLTDLDLTRPGALSGARAYVSMGHDEYWTPAMRRAVMGARDQGTNLVFLGADTEWWRIRLAGSSTGPRRTVIGYRWDYAGDPVRTRRPGLTTGPFALPPVPRPEEALTGMQYNCFPVDAPYVVTSPGWWGFAGTGVSAGERFPHLVGVEADQVRRTAATPRPIQVLSSARYLCRGTPTTGQSVYYTTPSGAGVFNAGTLRWTCAMRRRCGPVRLSRATRRFTRRVTDNVLRVFAQGPAGRTHPAEDNLAQYHVPTGTALPTD